VFVGADPVRCGDVIVDLEHGYAVGNNYPDTKEEAKDNYLDRMSDITVRIMDADKQ
jgi:hypothetical protein